MKCCVTIVLSCNIWACVCSKIVSFSVLFKSKYLLSVVNINREYYNKVKTVKINSKIFLNFKIIFLKKIHIFPVSPITGLSREKDAVVSCIM